MDMNVLNGTISVIVLALTFASACLQWWWYKREGGDERGKLISLKCTNIMFGTLVIGIAVLLSLDGSLYFTKQWFKIMLVSIIGLSMVAGTLSLLVLRRKY
ncbi:hypothetical protein E5161_16585 [Cohnella pontilimi]|uniref:DUF2178 domain-containing protein n=1 Tax=Cohnella pontilimi TaxID=2564100 RepID=A0A4U0FC07_9BACL|nr:hypothetical protein [Cohnella pontilimi]TJY40762.1 hypothetical protein E5161_16585 [Cohnella pontilimi]